MMKTNLGKSIFILSFMLHCILNADVTIKAPSTFYKNNVVTFTIEAIGSEIKMPKIQTIDGNAVQNAGTSQHTTIINGKRTYKFIQSYAMISSKDINLPSFEILIDNEIEKTQAKTIKMTEVKKTKSELYDLTISVNKQELYVGESLEFTLKFKYKKDLDIVNLEFTKPTFENFWVKDLSSPKKQNANSDYEEQEIRYLLFPQKSGDITIDSLKIGVTTAQNNYSGSFYFSKPTQSTAVYSNKLKINVKALPQNIKLIGNFTIEASIDKKNIRQGEAISYKLNINGRGNIDDLDEINLDIPHTTIYDNPSEKKYDIQNNLYGGKYSKTYSIIAKEDFTIPSIELKFFDKETQTVQTIQTQKFDIKVKETSPVEKKLEIAKPQTEEIEQIMRNSPSNIKATITSQKEKIIYFLLGLVSGIVSILLIIFIKNKKPNKQPSSLLKQVQKSSNSQELFKILFVYITLDEELDRIIYTLENLSQDQFKIEKKKIIQLLIKLEKKGIALDLQL